MGIERAVIIDPAHKALSRIIKDVIALPFSRCSLPRGLQISYRRRDTKAQFAIWRRGVHPSVDEIKAVVAAAGNIGFVLTVEGAQSGEREGWLCWFWDIEDKPQQPLTM